MRTIPDVEFEHMSFVYMWSTRVAELDVTRVGLVMSGKKPWLNKLST